MKGKALRIIKKHKAVVIIIALVLALCAGVTIYAEYTKSSRAKRVVASYGDAGTLFSSNYMAMVNNSIPNRAYVYTGSESTSATTTVTVCNYAQGNPTGFYNTRNITYRLDGRLVVMENGVKRAAVAADIASGMTVTAAFNGSSGRESFTFSSSNLSHTYTNSVLSYRASSFDECTLTFSPAFNTDETGVCLELTATPVPSGTYADIFPIDCCFSTAIALEPTRLDWEGFFNENGARNNTGLPAPSAHDGFNYVVTGTGVGTCKLSWRADAVDISQVFLTEDFPLATVNTESAGGYTWNYIQFSVDSDIQNRYDLQFYYVPDSGVSYDTWTAVKSYVKLNFTQS